MIAEVTLTPNPVKKNAIQTQAAPRIPHPPHQNPRTRLETTPPPPSKTLQFARKRVNSSHVPHARAPLRFLVTLRPRLVRYYRIAGFRAEREVGEDLGSLKDRLLWGAEGTLMTAKAEEFMGRWTSLMLDTTSGSLASAEMGAETGKTA